MFMDLQEIVYTPGTLEMLMFLEENIIDIDSLTLILSRTAAVRCGTLIWSMWLLIL